jgi:hypothetical protein
VNSFLVWEGTLNQSQARPWRTVEELVEIGFRRSRVVMMNEVHAGLLRCIRTRLIGQRILPTAHQLGVRHLAMEALYAQFVEEANHTRRIPEEEMGYLAQPEMRAFIQRALDLGWTLLPYEADLRQMPPDLSERGQNNWREEMQARNLLAALGALTGDAPLLVWCGNNHHAKALVSEWPNHPQETWAMMGYQFKVLSGLNPFAIDQGRTVLLPDVQRRPGKQRWLDEVEPQLTAFGGTAGFLTAEAPLCFPLDTAHDAWVMSLHNQME